MNLTRILKLAQAFPPGPPAPALPLQPPPPQPPKPWIKAKVSKRHVHKLSYDQGFADKCAELGVDPAALIEATNHARQTENHIARR